MVGPSVPSKYASIVAAARHFLCDNPVMIGLPQLRGYILEEALARLVKRAGYRLLVDAQQDLIELTEGPQGLLVRGRGGEHQADVLGQLTWVPAFSLPIRLFVEAKFHDKPVGLHTIRNAVGVIHDVNQHYRVSVPGSPILQRYTYMYAVFSASGFTRTSENYALAHQISVIDLSGASFGPLLSLVRDVANQMHAELVNQRGNGYVRRGDLRNEIRQRLDTWTSPRPPRSRAPLEIPNIESSVERLSQRLAAGFGNFFLGALEAPFVLMLFSDNPDYFIDTLFLRPAQQVSLNWDNSNGPSEWLITSLESDWTLKFYLPSGLERWLFESREEEDIGIMAQELKGSVFSTIAVTAEKGGRTVMGRLTFNSRAIRARRGDLS